MSEQQEQERMEQAREEGNMAMRIAVPEFVADKEEPFANDLLSREQRVRLLCDFTRSVSGHAVIAVDGGWGTGKSAFLRMCRAYLEQQGVRVAEFNAWTESYTTDPVFNLASALTEVMEKDQVTKLLETAKAIGVATLKNLPFKVGEIVSDTVEAISQDQAFPNGLPEYRECVRRFKELLEQEAGQVDGPLVVLVDELDRCLPQQVVEYLSAVHNILAVPGVVVVLGLNLDQAAKGLEAVYGSAYGSERYLQRFFDLRISLTNEIGSDDLSDFVKYLRQHLGVEIVASPSGKDIDALLSTTAQVSGGALRDLQRVAQALRMIMASRFGASADQTVNRTERHTEFFKAALALVVVRQMDPEGYRLFTGGKEGAYSLMKRLHTGYLWTETKSSWAAFVMLAYLDLLAGEKRGQWLTKEQFQDIADLYAFEYQDADYNRYTGFRQYIRGHLNDLFPRMVLAAVEMSAG